MCVTFKTLVRAIVQEYPIDKYHDHVKFLGHNPFYAVDFIVDKNGKRVASLLINSVNKGSIVQYSSYGFNKISDMVNDYVNEPISDRKRPKGFKYGLSPLDKKSYDKLFKL